MTTDPRDNMEVPSGPAVSAEGLSEIPHSSHETLDQPHSLPPKISFFSGWGRQERVALLLLIAVTIAVLAGHLVLSSLGKAPFARPYSNASMEGDLVLFRGVIERVTHTHDGGHLILEVEGLQVFVPAAAARGHTFHIGDAVSLYGTVQAYRGEREIVVKDGGDIWMDPDLH